VFSPRSHAWRGLFCKEFAIMKFAMFLLASTSIGGPAMASLQLTPGTLLVSSHNDGIIRQIDPITGATLSSVAAVYPNGASAMFVAAMTTLNGDVYVADGFQTLRLNLTTGRLTPLFANITTGMNSRPGQIVIQGDQFIYWYDTSGVLIDSLLVDNQAAGAELAFLLQDVAWTGSQFSLLYDQTGPSPAKFNLFRFNTDGSVAGSSVQFNRNPNFDANGFDIDLATNRYWVAMSSQFNPGTSSEVRLYEDFNPNALRTLQLPFGGASDIVYIVPTPASAAVLLGAGVFAVRRRR
jgi:hypothetical protein